MKIYRRILSAALAAICLCTLLTTTPAFASLSSGGLTSSLTPTSSATLGTPMDSGIYWIGCRKDTYQAINLQYDRTDSGIVLDPMDFQHNELFVLKPTDHTGTIFTLAPLSHPDYLIVATGYCQQLRVSKTSSSDPAAQWMAVADGSYYVLVNRKTGLAMDAENESSGTGTRILSYSRHNGFNQRFSIIRASESTSAVTFGRRVAPANNTYAILSSTNSNKCINDQFASKAGNGTAKIVLDTFSQESNECWVFTNRGNNQYTISPSVNANVCLNVWAACPQAGNQLTLAQYQPGDQCSLFEIYEEGGLYGLRNVRTGLWVNLWMNNPVDGEKIVGYYFDNSAAMKWKLNPVSASNSPAPPSNDSPILQRLEAMANGSYGGGAYRVNTRYTGAYYYEQCKGFAKKVHMVLFGYNIGSTKSNNYQISISSSNTKLVGTLTSLSSRGVNALRNLFSSARPGDFIQVRRTHGGPHSMIFLSADTNGVTVYECNVNGPNLIEKNTYSYSQFLSKNRDVSVYTAKNYYLH